MGTVKDKRLRAVFKVSGMALGPGNEGAFDFEKLRFLAAEIWDAYDAIPELELGIMPGGGNICRGSSFIRNFPGVDEPTAHYLGMISTIPNAVALKLAMKQMHPKREVRIASAFDVPVVAEPYVPEKLRSHLSKRFIVIFAGGLGVTGFTTDTGGIGRAYDMGASLSLKGTTEVEGVLDADPRKNPNAKLIPEMSYRDFQTRDLSGILDPSAVQRGLETKIPMRVFNITKKGNLIRALRGEQVGTFIH